MVKFKKQTYGCRGLWLLLSIDHTILLKKLTRYITFLKKLTRYITRVNGLK